jgi:hypothetical protein
MPPATGTAGTRAVGAGPAGPAGPRIAWTPALRAYFAAHFALIARPSSYLGAGDVPRRALYQEALVTGAEP